MILDVPADNVQTHNSLTLLIVQCRICTPKESKNHDISPVETCKEIGNNESPSPISSHNDKRPPSRRFSYTSANNRIANNIRDVPYARLMDHSPTNLLQPKLDSDSKLNNEHNISTLSVPEKEQTPKSSVSDSKLAVNYFTMASAEPQSLIECLYTSRHCLGSSSNKFDQEANFSHATLVVQDEDFSC
uniref:Uncharacterized protein n=1 Tax=Timema cristinae TaxID=61476 RepID=A0A7R9DBV4_TIMCR|nr:unnamed protein product [Timema cristinae]